jgi:hypothetical protein
MSYIKEKIDQLEATLIACNATVVNHFNPGMPREQVLELLSGNNIDPNPALIALYEWHNGTPYFEPGLQQVFIEILPEGFFYSLQDMVRLKKEFLDWTYLAEFLGDMNGYWPLFGSREDDMYLLKNNTGEIYYISPAVNIYGDLEFSSLDNLIDCVTECYQKKVFVIDQEKGLTSDFKAYEKLRSKYQ